MTSVLSRLLLSNGSKIIYISLCLMLLSCSTTQNTSARPTVIKKDEPDTRPSTDVEAVPVDTVKWTWEDEEEFPPITSEGEVASYLLDNVTKDRYEVALLLPMKLQQTVPNLDAINKKFADFYAGIKMAASKARDVRANVSVYYTDREEATLDNIIATWSFRKPDLIIASSNSALIKKTAEYARSERIPVISPWLSSTKVTSDNLFYLQMRPSIEEYYKVILEHVDANFDRNEVRIIQRADGSDRTKTMVLQKLQESISEIPLFTPYENIDVEVDSLMDAEANVFDTLITQEIKAFIIPNYSSKDDRYVYTCLRKMYGEKLGRDFTVYTMPVAIKSDRVDINILKNLDIRTPEFRFPDIQKVEVKAFKEAFLVEHGRLPSDDAFYGYDLMSFVSYGLANHGQYFHYFMAGEELDLMQMKVHISPFFKEETSERPDFMVNDHLYIIEYNTDHFEVSDRL